ncbi:MAG: nitrous oxide reductase family maturation protein NosD [Bacteroidales bacterium]
MKLILPGILCLLFLQLVIAQKIIVQPEGTVQSIKTAVEIANPGDTILVRQGVYYEGNILIKKPLTLIGENVPVLDGEDSYEIMTIASPHVTIEGFQFRNSGRSSLHDIAAIKCLDAHHIVIRNNAFEDTFFAIHMSNTNYSLIENNILQSKAEHEYELGNGIHLWKCNTTTIAGNTISGHRDGIYYEFVTNSITASNVCSQNRRYGLHFMFSHDAEYLDNHFSDNGAGVAVMYTHSVKMFNNTFEHNWGASSYGMLLKDIRDSEVFQNRFLGNTTGIFIEGTSRTVFKNNLFASNGWAIKLMGSSYDNYFSVNNFMTNTFDVSTNSSLALNQFEKNYWDKYQGYDLNRDGIGDIPFYPVNLFSVIVERIPPAIMLWRSFLVFLLDRAEKVIPAVTPENLRDDYPSMKPYDHT